MDFESGFFWLMAGLLIIVWLRNLASRSPTARGRIGESRVSNLLKSKLDSEIYHDVHDVILPVRQGSTQVDHIVLSKYGVFVVETKNYSGWIFGGEKQRTWTQTFRRKRFKFQNPLRQNYLHMKAVQEVLNLPMEFIHSVIMFVGDAEFRTPMPANVTTLRGGLKYIRSFREPIIDESRVSALKAALDENRLEPGKATRKAHLENLEKQKVEPTCPRCGKRMALRVAKKGWSAGDEFWGCSSFPRCRGMRSIR